jgi:predicted aconitase with swiveling domain
MLLFWHILTMPLSYLGRVNRKKGRITGKKAELTGKKAE